MSILRAALGVCGVMAAALLCQADPLGQASAFNLLAIGSSTLAGNVNTSADVTGRIAAANMVGTGTTVGSHIEDAYSSPNNYVLLSAAGFNAGESFNINANGNVYAPGGNGNINFNDGGTRVTSGGAGVDFDALRSYLESYSGQLGQLAANGSVGVAQDANNPSFLELYGSDDKLDVFTITAAQLGNVNRPLDIVTPNGATVIVNVTGSQATIASALYYMGVQHSGDDTANDRILFNFAGATAVTVNGQFSASILAPNAYLSGTSQMDGNFIAAQIGPTGEVHDALFDGTLPPYQSPAPEPASMALVGGGFLMAGLWRARAKGWGRKAA